jgi:hypothetical protein
MGSQYGSLRLRQSERQLFDFRDGSHCEDYSWCRLEDKSSQITEI